MLRVVFAVSAALLMMPQAARAELGGTEENIEGEARAMQMAHNKTAMGSYSVHELTKPTGTIKEFVLPNGQIFAVSWRGMTRPDLSSLFGSYYSEYSDAERQSKLNRNPHGRQSVTVESQHMRVSRGGHMRDIHGQAFIKSLVPDGVNTEDLR